MSKIHPFPEGVTWGSIKAFSGNHWTYPEEMWLFADPKLPTRVNCNLAYGCPRLCKYCYADAMIQRFTRAPAYPVGHADAVERAQREIRAFRKRRMIVVASMTDHLLPAVERLFAPVIIDAMELGHHILGLSKLTSSHFCDTLACVSDPHRDFRLTYGATITCLDPKAGEIEPGAPNVGERLRTLERVAMWGRDHPHRVNTWVSITPLHKWSNPTEIAELAFEAGASFCATELLHARSDWSRQVDAHATDSQIWTWIDGLLELSIDSHLPVFFKDEIRSRVLADAHACERYVRVLGNAFPGATVVYDEEKEDLTIELPKESVQVGLTRFF